ncbi:uncharacterized protein LOC141652467 [Silene latifolia]|uniref:uncharacterized protein LOC141652467 n=1 Tax=Silene latifolia TaxID=37657 RepID=UPI003D771C9D
MRTYDGTSVPQNHVAFYKEKMLAASIPSEYSIKSFANLINTFNQQFASSRELEKRSSDLYRITQKPDETLKAFLNRFNKGKVSIPRCNVGTAVEAFMQGVLPHSDLYGELTTYPCHTFEDVQAKTVAYIRLEEDKSYKVGASSNTKDYKKTNKKGAGYNRGSSHRTTPYTRPDHSEVNMTQEQQGKANVHPPISEHNLCVDISGLIQRLDNMGPVVRWPRKVYNLNPRRDQAKWCVFHMDVGHATEHCFTLRKEVAYLLKAGYLKDLIKTKGIPDLHHDGLVIYTQIGTANVRRILIDGGSSVNLIMLDVLKAMKIKKDQITKKSSVLVGFMGETRNTLGQIYLPNYTEGVASYE